MILCKTNLSPLALTSRVTRMNTIRKLFDVQFLQLHIHRWEILSVLLEITLEKFTVYFGNMATASAKLRILAIHGYAQSDITFKTKLGSLRKGFKKDAEFIFIRAPHRVPMKSNFGVDETEEGYGWWFNTEDCVFKAVTPSNLSAGFDDSVALVERTFNELGPFDGVLGFSQGAAFVAVLCSMQQKRLLQIKFDFAIIISGFKSLCMPHAVYYDERITIPSLHVYGEADQVIPTEMAEEVSELFVNKTISKHEGGHYVPSKKEFYKEFITEMCLNKEKNNN